MTIGVEEHVVRLDVSVDDALTMDVSQGTAQLGNPEANSLFSKCFSRDMESQIATTHQVDDEVPKSSR